MNGMAPGRGYTLVEIVIVLAVVAILASLALPGYQGQVLRSNRAGAIALLSEGASCLERHRARHGSYEGHACAPRSSDHYRLDAVDVGRVAYTLQAVPLGRQARDPCGTLMLDAVGRRAIAGDGVSARCWALR